MYTYLSINKQELKYKQVCSNDLMNKATKFKAPMGNTIYILQGLGLNLLVG